MSLLKMCSHFRGCYVHYSMEFGSEDNGFSPCHCTAGVCVVAVSLLIMLFDIELPNELKGFLFYAQVSFEKTNVAITVYMYMYMYMYMYTWIQVHVDTSTCIRYVL